MTILAISEGMSRGVVYYQLSSNAGSRGKFRWKNVLMSRRHVQQIARRSVAIWVKASCPANCREIGGNLRQDDQQIAGTLNSEHSEILKCVFLLK
jgi:hypothetical protein